MSEWRWKCGGRCRRQEWFQVKALRVRPAHYTRASLGKGHSRGYLLPGLPPPYEFSKARLTPPGAECIAGQGRGCPVKNAGAQGWAGRVSSHFQVPGTAMPGADGAEEPRVPAAWSPLGLPWGAEWGTPGPPLLTSPSAHVSFPLPWTPTLPSLAGSISPLSHAHLGAGHSATPT